MRKNGETNPVTILLFIAIAGVAFFAFHVGPLYIDNLEAREAANEGFNNYFLRNEVYARDMLLARLNDRSPNTSHYAIDDNGNEVVRPGYGLTQDNLSFIYNEQSKELTVRIEYDRMVVFSPLKKRKIYHLIAEKKGKRLQ